MPSGSRPCSSASSKHQERRHHEHAKPPVAAVAAPTAVVNCYLRRGHQRGHRCDFALLHSHPRRCCRFGPRASVVPKCAVELSQKIPHMICPGTIQERAQRYAAAVTALYREWPSNPRMHAERSPAAGAEGRRQHVINTCIHPEPGTAAQLHVHNACEK